MKEAAKDPVFLSAFNCVTDTGNVSSRYFFSVFNIIATFGSF